ncbi:biotin/lipoyl-containing protein [Thalassomonas sp. RHCl1]|uniref:biotin/lipoyl-containing protein n=1 Tax=Thalassomonas sp. RHCl1 TaxID=2995320 RepID=UPI00248AE1F8|nr:biotin/lipoyl-containing protein [Thalassomonas sp. RHCl1]
MHSDVVIPHLPEAVPQAEIADIYVNQGQQVKVGDHLFDVETDKVVLEVVADVTGIIDEFNISQGDSVTSGQVVMKIRPQRDGEVPVEAKNSVYPEQRENTDPLDVVVPILPESVAHGVISTIHVHPGQQVQREQCLFDVETDKVVLEVVAETNGIVSDFTIAPGHWVNSGQVVMQLMPQMFETSPEPAGQIQQVAAMKGEANPVVNTQESAGKGVFTAGSLLFGIIGLVLGVLVTAVLLG